MTQPLKDDRLAALAAVHNVARFISFGPGLEPQIRHSFLRQGLTQASSPEEAVQGLLEIAKACNVRTFHSYAARGTPFHYGLQRVDEVLSLVRAYAQEGYYTIVNETLDVNDGGVSGVTLGGILEFAPQDTPRAVESPGILSIEYALGIDLLATVYGFTPDIPNHRGQRIEFSLHPNRVGYRKSHTVLWQLDEIAPIELRAAVRWPNRFSRFLGDKAFGLLVAHTVGTLVPETTVISRTVAPFTFGKSTCTGERWLRTCPAEPEAGRFPTLSSWADPFKLMQSSDSAVDSLASVLSQHSVDSKFSGGSWPELREDRIEGVTGYGDQFMLGRKAPESLPNGVVGDVRAMIAQLRRSLGRVRTEWAHDGSTAWLLQVHVEEDRARAAFISPGTATQWLRFDPSDGLDRLREIIENASALGKGIKITRPVGVTSHVGELLREAQIPARIIGDA